MEMTAMELRIEFGVQALALQVCGPKSIGKKDGEPCYSVDEVVRWYFERRGYSVTGPMYA